MLVYVSNFDCVLEKKKKVRRRPPPSSSPTPASTPPPPPLPQLHRPRIHPSVPGSRQIRPHSLPPRAGNPRPPGHGARDLLPHPPPTVDHRAATLPVIDLVSGRRRLIASSHAATLRKNHAIQRRAPSPSFARGPRKLRTGPAGAAKGFFLLHNLATLSYPRTGPSPRDS